MTEMETEIDMDSSVLSPDGNAATAADTKAWFGERVGESVDAIYRVALRLTWNSTDAEDLVADAVAKAWRAIDSLEDRSRFRPWLFRILHNCHISDFRRKAVRPTELAYDDIVAGGEEEDGDVASLLIGQPEAFLLWWGNPEREFANRLLGEDILAAIEKLPGVYRMAVLLVNVEGLSYDEAAEALGVPPGTIRSRMKRGRTLLQKALWQHALDAGLVSGNERGETGDE